VKGKDGLAVMQSAFMVIVRMLGGREHSMPENIAVE
jgi:hypothetical protein